MSLWYENIYFIYKKETSKLKDLADNSILLAGSDTPNPFVIPGISLHEELELLSKAGISNYEILKAATINGAKFVDKEKSIGTVEEGKVASLLILDSNPLDDINNSKDISGVILHGNYISKKELDDKVKIYR
jgi:imidazolonepropionase-like amidohydrolase